MQRLPQLYATADVRALAAGRVALAVVLLVDLAKRVPGLSTWYSNEGLLPNHTLLWRPTYDPAFSPFFMASHAWQAAIGFAICAVAYLALLLGWRTKVAQVCSLVAVLGLHGRVLFLQNGGDVVLSLLALWTVFLPTGERYSVDAWLAQRQTPDQQAAEASGKVVSLAVVAVLLQLTVIYAFNAVHKTGGTWRAGSVVHYVLHQDRIVTAFGTWLRERMPLKLGQCLTWSALGIEVAIPLLLLCPWRQRVCRRAAVVLVVMLHVGFALLLNLGVFSIAMMAYTPNLLLAADWNAFDRWLARHKPRLVAAWLIRIGQWITIADAHLPRTNVTLSAQTRTRMREPLVAVFITLAASQVLVENDAVPKVLKPRQSAPVEAAITYLQLFQGWSMFAPDAPPDDFTLVVDAVTASGKHVDPLSEAASSRNFSQKRQVPARLGHDSFFCDYIARIGGHGAYHQALIEWIERYPQRTGNSADAIVSFDLIELHDVSPPPGQTQPLEPTAKTIFRHTF